MALTPSTMLPLGTDIIDFTLPDPSGKTHSPKDFKDAKALLVIFICNHCPYVIHIADALAAFHTQYRKKGVEVIAINSNDYANPKYALDGPSYMVEESKKRGYGFPYVIDEDQSVAKAYDAACTPDLYLFDGDRKLVYRGEFDSSRPGKGEADGSSLIGAVESILQGKEVSGEQKPAMGCNIKWKS